MASAVLFDGLLLLFLNRDDVMEKRTVGVLFRMPASALGIGQGYCLHLFTLILHSL